MDNRVKPGELREDQATSYLENRTARVPSSVYLGAAIASMGLSLAFKLAGKNSVALFLGQWAAPFLVIGTYNKMVRQHGSDTASQWERAA